MRDRVWFRPCNLLVVAVIGALLGGAALTPAMSQEGTATEGGAPAVVSYQGQVRLGGVPFTGTGYFKFAVVDSGGGTNYWANDGKTSGEPDASAVLSVSQGLFNVLLGDAGLGMVQVPATAFSGTDRYLRVWFSSSGSAFTLLSPDRRIAAVPYALQAQEAANAAALGGLESSAYQARVSGACPAGTAVRAVNPDGTVTCEAPDPRPGYSRTAADASGLVGAFSSITIGSDGLPLVSYQDGAPNYDVRVLHCGNTACTAGNTVTAADTEGRVGDDTAITVGADGLPVVSHLDQENWDLRVLHCGDTGCTSGNTSAMVDSAGDVGRWSSITVGVDGLPVISYYDMTNGDLKVAHCTDLACSSGTTLTTVDSAADVGRYTSITTGADGLPIVSYFDSTNSNLKVLHCGDAACTAGNTAITADSLYVVGLHTSITIGSDGLPVVSYSDWSSPGNADLKVLHCGDAACTAGNTVTTVDSAGDVGYYTSITTGADGLPLISYSTDDNFNFHLKVAHCGDLACTSGNTTWMVDSSGLVGRWSSITTGMDGLPVLSYWDASSNALVVMHCSNAFCVPYWRRR